MSNFALERWGFELVVLGPLSDFQGAERERESKLIKSRQTRTHLNRYFSTFNRRFKHIFASQMQNNQHNTIVTIENEISCRKYSKLDEFPSSTGLCKSAISDLPVLSSLQKCACELVPL